MEDSYSLSWRATTGDVIYRIPDTDIYDATPSSLVDRFVSLEGLGLASVLAGQKRAMDKIIHEAGELEIEVLSTEEFLKSVTYTLPSGEGFSNTFYTRFFMPKWSTAYKYPFSNHVKTVEPIFSHLVRLPALVEAVKDDTEPKYKARRLQKGGKRELSEKDYRCLVEDIYLLGSNKTLDFGREFNTIYIDNIEGLSLTLIVSGVYKTSYIECKVVLKSGYIKLPLKFSKIFNIEATADNTELYEGALSVKVGNILSIKGALVEARQFNKIEVDNKIVLLNSIGEQEMVFTVKPYDGIWIDANDRVVTIHEDIVSSGKLEVPLEGVASDISSNNSPYISVSNYDNTHYAVHLFLRNYLIDTNSQKVRVSIVDSEGVDNRLILNQELQLVPYSEDIWITDTPTSYITLHLEVDADKTTIMLEDWDGRYTHVSHIDQPSVELAPAFTSPAISMLEDKLVFKGASSITMLEE